MAMTNIMAQRSMTWLHIPISTNYRLEPRALVNRGSTPFPTLDFDGFSASPGYTGRHIQPDPDNTRTITLILIPPTPSQWTSEPKVLLSHAPVSSFPSTTQQSPGDHNAPPGDDLSCRASLFLDSVVRVRAPAGIFRPSVPRRSQVSKHLPNARLNDPANTLTLGKSQQFN
jgi:hypothetical protein